MKAIARGYMWWPKLDSKVEDLAKSCVPCLMHLQCGTITALALARPTYFEKVNVEFAELIQITVLLVLVDAHSKWPAVFPMSTTTTGTTIEALTKIFAAHGIPKQLVSDNGSQFVSWEFAEFMRGNGVHHVQITPYLPASNGLAEHFVQSGKMVIKQGKGMVGVLTTGCVIVLLKYCNIPHATT